MPQIKTSLKELFALFMRSAQSEQLESPVRQLAARMTVLVAHMQRIEAKLDIVIGAGQKLEKTTADLATALLAIDQRTGGTPAAAPAAEPMSEEEEMAARVMAETEADIAKTRANVPPAGNGSPAAVTPIRAPIPAPAQGDAS
jgi:hypothetical protein